ncbi:MAG: hypothetical protein IJ776_05980 [Paludibacteraceae bacterium]|nr:hypothetical protein [Paludibacteraceae bacterium]
MKSTIAVIALLASSFAFAQEKEKTFTFEELQLGDSVMIRENITHYLTGEEPSKWVYGNKFTVMQKGTKRFPEGILLKPIVSWIGAEYLYLPGQEEQKTDSVAGTAAPQEQGAAAEQQDASKAGKKNAAAGAAGTQEGGDGTETQQSAGEATQGQETAPQGQETTQTQEQTPVEQGEQTEQQGEQQPIEKTSEVKTVSDPLEPHFTDTMTNAFHRFSIGVRGGVASLMHNNEDVMGNWKLGFDALLDLQYAYYFAHRADKKATHGILTGVSIGYSRSPISNPINSDYSITGDDGEQIDYHIEAANVDEKDGQLQIEVPLMYSLLVKGFFLNIGPKFMMPVFTHYNQTLTDPHVNAYFNDMGVTVSDEVITGYVEDNDLKTKGNWGKAKTKISIMATAELGYEWQLKSGNALGLGVYANYAPWNSFKNDTENTSLIKVEAPSGSTPAGAADILSATDTYTKGMNYFDGGVKLVYHFNFPVKKHVK